MTLAPGTRLGAYEIVALLGAGGMGEVYRARDTRLGRDVAIKVLPAGFAADADRLQRFKREAQVLASLNHPHIAAIYSVEETTGVTALVLELVDGPTLADRIARGGIPFDEGLPIARQIAEALEAAHERGIIHRDLKPANIKLTAEENVKVLDFGLAKAVEAPGSAGLHANISQSPTLASPVMTMGSVILGTAAYMSPEQAKGRAADKRSDIWGFGCILYEMLTGTRPFAGEDITEVMTAILRDEPQWSRLPSDVPAAVRSLLQRCLEKDPRRRIGDISAARFVLEDPALSAVPARSSVAHLAEREPWRWRIAALAVAAIVGAALGVFGLQFAMPIQPATIARLSIVPPSDTPLVIDGITRDVGMSPDGSRVAWVTHNGNIVVRALDQLTPSVITGLGSARHPTFSPDGQWIAFFDGNESVKKVAASGGPATTLLGWSGGARGLTWNVDKSIIFAKVDGDGLVEVPSGGGPGEVLTQPDRNKGEVDHLWPQALPGGKAVLFTITRVGGADESQLAVLDLASRKHRVLLQGGTDGHFIAPGFLVYATAGVLRGVRFDLETLSVIGSPVSLIEGLGTTPQGAKHADFSADGALAYIPVGELLSQRTLVWVDRAGREEPLPGAPARAYMYPRVSPDGSQVAVVASDQDYDVWRWDSHARTMTRATFDAGMDTYPVWTPDGKRLLWSSQRDGPNNVYAQFSDGTGPIERLTNQVGVQYPNSVTPDGKHVLLRVDARGKTGTDVMMLTLGTPNSLVPVVATTFVERNVDVSPDGRWIAYQSNETGQFEIYVRPFPNVDVGKWAISNGGGEQPLWAKRGGTLFYRGKGGAIVSVTIETTGGGLRAGQPMKILDAYFTGAGAFIGRTYDVSPDDSRFLMVKEAEGTALPSIVVVQNWRQELENKLGK